MLIPVPGLERGSRALHISPCLSPVAVFGTRRMGPAAADGLSLPCPCPTDKGSLCWPGVVSSVIHWGCLETDAREVRSWKRSISEMAKLNFALKWKQVCREKSVCLCPSSAFGSLQAMAGAGRPGPSAWAGHEAMGRGRGSACAPGSPAPKSRVLHPCQRLEMDVEIGMHSSCCLMLSWSPSWWLCG